MRQVLKVSRKNEPDIEPDIVSGDYVEKVSENFGRMIRDNSRHFAGHVSEKS